MHCQSQDTLRAPPSKPISCQAASQSTRALLFIQYQLAFNRYHSELMWSNNGTRVGSSHLKPQGGFKVVGRLDTSNRFSCKQEEEKRAEEKRNYIHLIRYWSQAFKNWGCQFSGNWRTAHQLWLSEGEDLRGRPAALQQHLCPCFKHLTQSDMERLWNMHQFQVTEYQWDQWKLNHSLWCITVPLNYLHRCTTSRIGSCLIEYE